MKCEHCALFCESKWRTNPDAEEEGKKKSIAKARYCAHVDKYISGQKEICDDGFKPYHLFWCDRNNYQQHVEACLARAAKGMCEECYGCSQHAVIVDVQKARFFMKRRMLIIAEEESKPKLIRRTP